MKPQYRVVGRTVEITENRQYDTALVGERPSEVHLFDYQKFIVDEATAKQRYAIFADCGLGKTAMFLAWIRRILPTLNGKKVLIISPLMVIEQTLDEEAKFYGERAIKDIHNENLEKWLESGPEQVGITNFEKFHEAHNLAEKVGALVLDESSILKNADGKTRMALVESARGIAWKLCCSATPAPNDREEYANHATFLEYVRSNNEFFSMFFVNKDNGWEIKSHGLESFYKYLSGWSVFCRHPEKYGFSDNLAKLPPPIFNTVKVAWTPEQRAFLKSSFSQTSFAGNRQLIDAFAKRKFYIDLSRGFVKKDGEIVRVATNKTSDLLKILQIEKGRKCVIWISFNEEERILKALIKDAGFKVAAISGATQEEERVSTVKALRDGALDVLISKPRLLGFGLNLPFVTVQIFYGLTDSYEQFYQCVRRSHRFGATESTRVYLPVTEAENQVLANVMRKKETFEEDSEKQEGAFIRNLKGELIAFLRSGSIAELMAEAETQTHEAKHGEEWTTYNGDNVPILRTLKPESVDLAVFSPPFANLFTYSSALEDMGNSRDHSEFYLQFEFFLQGLYPVMKQGRLVCCHLSQLAALKSKDGYVGLHDFRGDIIRLFRAAGFTYFGEWCIAKNPQMQAIKEKVRSLAFAQLERDRLGSKPGLNDYILIFKKPGEPTARVNDPSGPSRDEWIEWASGVWMGVRESDTLNVRGTKSEDDVKHICPMNLEVVRRCVRMYSGPSEVVLDPFMGIGTTGVISMELGRRFVGIELKKEYFNTATENIGETKKNESLLSYLATRGEKATLMAYLKSKESQP